MKGKYQGNSQDVFSIAPPIYVPTSFKLMALPNIRVNEALLSKGATVTMKQTSHPV